MSTPPKQLMLPFTQPEQRPRRAGAPWRRPAGQPRSDRLFFAVVPDEAAKARLAALVARLRDEHGLTGRPTATGCLHVSLCGVDARASSALEQAGGGIAMHPFPVTFDRVLSFKGSGNRPIVVLGGGDCLAELTALRTTVGAEMAEVGMGRHLRLGFTPHLTLLYDRHPVRAREIDPIRWTVREVVLVRSLYGSGRHVHLLRRPLRQVAN